jgi:hypothetical protein
LDIDASDKPDGNCFPEGSEVVVHVNKGVGSDIVTGAQFLINYDSGCLDFTGASAGAAFPMLIYSDVDEDAGTVFVAVGVTPGTPGTAGAAELATLTFNKLPGCGTCNLCFDSVNPQNTILSDATGQPASVELNCSKDIRLSGDVTLNNVPDSVNTNPDCGYPTAIVTWDPITASDTCDGDLDNECDEDDPNICCTNIHSGGVDIDHLAEAGGEFPQGTSTFCCTATNSCGNSVEECWTVVVSDQHSMDIVVQLSPVMAAGPLTRCICFEFFPDCVQNPTVWCEDLVFGPPYDFPGHNTTKIKVPKGQYACITAADCLHTLRSVSDIECVGDQLVAEFKGDPFFGGNWLINGNVHDGCWKDGANTDVIDILDFGVFVSQFGMLLNPNTPCGTAGPHSDINGDGVVNMSDYVFISQNFLEESKDSCCPDANAAAIVPVTSITVKELRRLGLSELAIADLNGDGTLDQADMTAFVQGQLPQRDSKSEGRGGSTRPSLGQ